MIRPIHVDVPTTVSVTINQPQIIPYIRITPLREWFDLDKLKSNERYPYLGRGVKGDFAQLKRWANTPGKGGKKRNALELHLPASDWYDLKRNASTLLIDPAMKPGIFCVAGKNFNKITGHPAGTEMFVINDTFYRRLTWRSITNKFWDKKAKDAGIAWKDGEECVYFLYKCEKINEEPIKSLLIDSIGVELMDRDRPKPKKDEDRIYF